MTIEVTQEDIKKGERCGIDSCAVALAVQRAVDKDVAVDAVYICYGVVGEPKTWVHHRTPPEVREFVNDFDAGKPVQPFSFEL